MGGLTPEQRQAQIVASIGQNLNAQNQQGQFGSSGSGALGVGGFGAPRNTGPSTNIDTTSYAGQQLLKSYQESGVVFDSNNNIIYNPADLGASRANAINIAQGLPSYKETNTPSQSYLNSLKSAGVDTRSITNTKAELVNLQTENATRISDLQNSIKNLDRANIDAIQLGLRPSGNLLQGMEQNRIAQQKERTAQQIDYLQKQQGNIIAALAGLEKKKVEAGAAQIKETSPLVTPTENLFKQSESQKRASLLLGSQGKAANAINAQLQYQKSINQQSEGVLSPFNVQKQSGQIKVREPLQYSPLTGSTITARQLKDLQAGRTSEESILGFQPIKIAPEGKQPVAASGFFPVGIPTAAAELSGPPKAPIAPVPPKKLTQAQVNNLSNTDYQKYVQSINDYNSNYDQYQKDFDVYKSQVGKYNIDITSTSEKQRISDVRKIVGDFRNRGLTEVNIITDSGIKVVPIAQATTEAVRAGNSLKAIGPSAINLPSGVLTGNLVNFPNSLAIFPEQKETIGPQVPPLLNASLQIQKATGISILPREAVNAIDVGLELNKPIEQRSNQPRVGGLEYIKPFIGPLGSLPLGSNQEIAVKLAPISNFAANYIYDPLRTGVAALQGKEVLNPNYKPGTEQTLFKPEYVTPPQETFIGNLFEGKPTKQERILPSIEGEVILAAGTMGIGEAISKGLQYGPKIGTKIGGELKISAARRELKPIEKTYQLESQAPINIEQTQTGAFNIFRSQEVPRGQLTQKIQRQSFKVKPDLTEGSTANRPQVKLPEFEIKIGAEPKKVNIPQPPKNPQPRVPYAYVEPGGTIAEVLKEPIKGPKTEIGKIITAPKGALSETEVTRLGLEKQTVPQSPLDIYTVKATDNINKVLAQAEESGYLKKITDIRLGSTKESSSIASAALKTAKAEKAAKLRSDVNIAAGRTGRTAKDYLSGLVNNIKLNIKEPSVLEQRYQNPVKQYTSKEAIQSYKETPEAIKFFRKRIERPTTIGYYEIGDIGIQTAKGRELGAKISERVLKGFEQKGVPSFETGSKGLDEILKNVSTKRFSESQIEKLLKTTQGEKTKSSRPFNFNYLKETKGGAGATGKAQRLLTKEDESLLRNIVPKIAQGTKTKARPIIPTGPTGLIGILGKGRKPKSEYQQFKYTEPLGIVGYTPKVNSKQILKELIKERQRQRRQNQLIGIRGLITPKEPIGIFGQIPSNKKKQKQIAEGTTGGIPRSPYGGIVIEKINAEVQTPREKRKNKITPMGVVDTSTIGKLFEKLGTKPETSEKQNVRVGIIPLLGQSPIQGAKTTPVQKTTPVPLLKQIPVPLTPEIIIPKIPEPTRTPPPPTRYRGFGLPPFLPYGGGTGPTGRGSKRGITKFVASEVDPLRAGVLVPDNVTELVGYTPKVFTQIDINLGRARRKKGASKGINGEPFSGFNDTLLVKNNLGGLL